MATKSFLKTIDIKDRTLGNALADALDKCEDASSNEIHFKSNPKEIRGAAVKDFFDSYKKKHAKF